MIIPSEYCCRLPFRLRLLPNFEGYLFNHDSRPAKKSCPLASFTQSPSVCLSFALPLISRKAILKTALVKHSSKTQLATAKVEKTHKITVPDYKVRITFNILQQFIWPRNDEYSVLLRTRNSENFTIDQITVMSTQRDHLFIDSINSSK